MTRYIEIDVNGEEAVRPGNGYIKMGRVKNTQPVSTEGKCRKIPLKRRHSEALR